MSKPTTLHGPLYRMSYHSRGNFLNDDQRAGHDGSEDRPMNDDWWQGSGSFPEPDPINPNRPHINVYTCPDGHELVTVDVAEGVTPFMLACRRRGCDHMATSCMYRCPQFRLPTHEWYHPLIDEYLTLDEDTKEHVKMGGLLIRLIGVETPEAAEELEARRLNIATVLWDFMQYLRKRPDVTILRDLDDDAADHIIQEFVYK